MVTFLPPPPPPKKKQKIGLVISLVLINYESQAVRIVERQTNKPESSMLFTNIIILEHSSAVWN